MKRIFLAAMFGVIMSGRVFAGGSAIADLESGGARSAESISFATPKAAAMSQQGGGAIQGKPAETLRHRFRYNATL